MSSKAKALFKRLRTKAIEEKQKEKNENPDEGEYHKSESVPVEFKSNFISDLKIENNKEKEIDPLDYFKTERIKIEPTDMNDYDLINELVKSDSDEDDLAPSKWKKAQMV